MNDNDNENDKISGDRPLGFWLRVVDGLLTREFAAALASEGVDRRDWMLLNAVSGDIEAPWLADRLARGGKHLRGLAERGWITRDDDAWAVTEEGRAAKDRLDASVDGIRSRITDAAGPEAYAAMTATLEAIARELGWDESQGPRDPGRRFGPGSRGFGPGRGFGPAFGGGRGFDPGHGHGFRGFGPGSGFGLGHGYGPAYGYAHGEACHPHHRGEGEHRGRGRGRRHDERAYERGFEAGFTRGRDAAASGTPA